MACCTPSSCCTVSQADTLGFAQMGLALKSKSKEQASTFKFCLCLPVVLFAYQHVLHYNPITPMAWADVQH